MGKMVEGLRAPAAKRQHELTSAQALLLVLAASQLLFTINLGRPAQPFFDEMHYLPAARSLIAGIEYGNIEHPPFAKFLIGLSMALFGDTPFGWRLIGSFMGTATAAGVFLIAQALFRDVKLSVYAATFALLNHFLFVQARIAMLDVFMSGLLLPAIWLLIDAYGGRRVRLKLALSGVLFGLAVGCKWAAVPYLAAGCLAYLLIRLRRPHAWPGVSTLAGLALLGGVSLVAYLASFAPAFFVERNPLTLTTLIPHQIEIYRQQTLPLAPHGYMSDWWDWPLIGRPIWYLYEPVQGLMAGVLLVGNPAIMWGGLGAVAACLIAGFLSRDPRLLLTAGLFLFAYGIWIIIPKKIGFYYYYYLPALFLPIALAAFFCLYCNRKGLRWLPRIFTAAAATLFIYFYPILSAAPLDNEMAFLHWTWFESWK